jgi:hypothetical protein
MPRIRINRGPDGEDEIRAQIEEGLSGLRALQPGLRMKVEGEVNRELDRELPRAMDELRRTLKDRIVIPSRIQVRTVNRVIL